MPDLEDLFELHVRTQGGYTPTAGWPNDELAGAVDDWYQMSRDRAFGTRISDYTFKPGAGDASPSILFDAAGANLLQVFPALDALVQRIDDQLATSMPEVRFVFVLGPG